MKQGNRMVVARDWEGKVMGVIANGHRVLILPEEF